jgi:RimJ/RimL family protein N-acetyltransferase
MPRPAQEIVFRPFCQKDGAALLSWAPTADELLQWVGPNFAFPLDERQLLEYLATAGRHRRIISAIACDTDAVVGHAELNILSEHELGQIRRFAVAPSIRGHGVGARLMDWLVSFAFDELSLHRLELVVFSFNVPARKCYARAGFQEEGVARHARKASNGYWDLVHMALLESEYRARSDGRLQGDQHDPAESSGHAHDLCP